MQTKAYCEQEKIFIQGEITFDTVMLLLNDSLILFAKLKEIDIDFSKVTFVNSAAIALLIEWIKYAKTLNKSLKFSHLPEEVRSLADVVGLHIPLSQSVFLRMGEG